jgi:RNA recognition motif-containing protein
MNIYVGNLNSATEEDLKEIFGEYGQVSSVKIVKDFETGRSRGFGFVEMSQTDGKKAIEELNDSKLNGYTLIVNEARERQPRDSSRGGRNNSYGGRSNRRF